MKRIDTPISDRFPVQDGLSRIALAAAKINRLKIMGQLKPLTDEEAQTLQAAALHIETAATLIEGIDR